ncbi:hypothetical protein ACLBOM_07125 [Escherichia coli]
MSYLDVLRDKAPGRQQGCHHRSWRNRVDTAMYLSQPGESTSQNIARFWNQWGIQQQPTTGWWLKPAGNADPA